MEMRKRRTRAVLATLGLFLVGLAILVAGLYSVPRYRWRGEIAWLKLSGHLPAISWKELHRLNRHEDPFHLQDLVTNHSPYRSIQNPFKTPDDLSAGGRLFESNCSFCHGSDGTGGRAGPALRQRQISRGGSDWALFQIITHGIDGTAMPPSPLGEDDRWKLAAFVKSISEGARTARESPFAARLAGIRPVRYEDILASAQDTDQWLTYSGSYDGQRFSPNAQLTPLTVSKLRLGWMRQYSSDIPNESSPLVVDGFLFVTIPPNRVDALDAKTGQVVWSYYRGLPERLSVCCGFVNRGLAVLGRTLFLGTIDGHLIALDIRTGSVLWDVVIGDYKLGYSITSAPLVLKNLVITGVAGGEFGARGFITARDAATGKEVWRFNSIPDPGQPGSETWKAGTKTGGGPTWLTGSFDRESNLIYWPIGNPSPNFNGDVREGDNLYTDCVVALDPDSGKLRWFFQFTPHDQYDWDATEILVSFDKTVEGKPRHLLAQADRNAFYYLFDRDSGHFISARQFSHQTWAKGIDAKGRPILIDGAVPKPEGTTVYPSGAGATNWMSPSYSPVTGLIYVPATEAGANYYISPPDYHPGELFTGGTEQTFENPPQQAFVRALDAMTGEMRWEYRYESWSAGGNLSTKGGLVFAGLGPLFVALDAKSGQELWHVDTGGTIRAAPITYLVDGKQYVTVAAGHDLLTFTE